MPPVSHIPLFSGAAAMAILLCACASGPAPANNVAAPAPARTEALDAARFEQDRQSILAMAGDFKVSFEFIETVSFDADYTLKPPKVSGGYEVVRVIEDRGDFISLQHILVASHGEATFPIKHWRQDWQYQPQRILSFTGGNSWQWRDVGEAERRGAWSQTVYQVDDAPRYSAVARWTYDLGPATWAPPHEWRPLPRRDMTTRSDYHTINAVNRHVITPLGWVHEQDNDKLVLSAAAPFALAREVGVNTYQRDSGFAVDVAVDYWAATDPFWKEIRAEWADIASGTEQFGLTVQGESDALYRPLLELAQDYADGKVALSDAVARGRETVRRFVTTRPAPLADRIAATPVIAPEAP